MDDMRDDFENELDEDETEESGEDDELLDDEDDDDGADDDDEDEQLDQFGLHVDEEEEDSEL